MNKLAGNRLLRFHSALLLTLLLAVLSTLLGSCGGKVDPVTSPAETTFQPQRTLAIKFYAEKEPSQGYMLTILGGKLMIDDNGYIRVEGVTGKALIVWPYGYNIKQGGEDIWILDENGEEIYHVGDEVKVGGGLGGKDTAEQRIGAALPEGCEGPYFLAAPEW
jgi:hypothetical protein